jgi:hypothetical protein
MKALGMGNNEISKNLGRGVHGAHNAHVSRDPLVAAEIERQRERLLGTARETLTSAVNKAAQNFHDKVNEGDMKASEKVLEFAGIFKTKSDTNNVNVNMNFGSWLSEAQQENALLIGSSAAEPPPRIIHDVDDIPDEELDLQGERLTSIPNSRSPKGEEETSHSINDRSTFTFNRFTNEEEEGSLLEDMFGGGIKGTL